MQTKSAADFVASGVFSPDSSVEAVVDALVKIAVCQAHGWIRPAHEKAAWGMPDVGGAISTAWGQMTPTSRRLLAGAGIGGGVGLGSALLSPNKKRALSSTLTGALTGTAAGLGYDLAARSGMLPESMSNFSGDPPQTMRHFPGSLGRIPRGENKPIEVPASVGPAGKSPPVAAAAVPALGEFDQITNPVLQQAVRNGSLDLGNLKPTDFNPSAEANENVPRYLEFGQKVLSERTTEMADLYGNRNPWYRGDPQGYDEWLAAHPAAFGAGGLAAVETARRNLVRRGVAANATTSPELLAAGISKGDLAGVGIKQTPVVSPPVPPRRVGLPTPPPGTPGRSTATVDGWTVDGKASLTTPSVVQTRAMVNVRDSAASAAQNPVVHRQITSLLAAAQERIRLNVPEGTAVTPAEGAAMVATGVKPSHVAALSHPRSLVNSMELGPDATPAVGPKPLWRRLVAGTEHPNARIIPRSPAFVSSGRTGAGPAMAPGEAWQSMPARGLPSAQRAIGMASRTWAPVGGLRSRIGSSAKGLGATAIATLAGTGADALFKHWLDNSRNQAKP